MQISTIRRAAAACSVALALVASAVQAQAPAAPTKPLVAVAINSYSGLMEDIDYIGSLVNFPNASQTVDGLIAQMTGGQGLAGLDKSQPIGLLVDMPPMGMFPNFAAYLPVSDASELVGVLAPFGVASQDMGDGVLQVTVNGQDVYAKTTGGWTVVGMTPMGFEALPADPSEALAPLTSQYDVAVQLNVQSLPDGLRQQAAAAMGSAQSSLRKEPGESDADFAARQSIMQTQMAATQQWLSEMDQVLIGLAIAGEQQKVMLDMNFVAVPGTSLAAEMATDAQSTTNFAGFAQPDAAAWLSFAGPVHASNMATVEQVIAGLRAKLNAAIEEEAPGELQGPLREAMAEFIDAIAATVKANKVDGGAVLKMSPGSVAVVAGGLITEPAKIESGLKKLADALASSEGNALPPIAWNAETHGDVTFHTMDVPVPDAKAQQIFGETAQVVVGLGAQSAYIAFGRDAAAALKEIIDASAAAGEKSVPSTEAAVSLGTVLGTLATIADEDDKAPMEMVAGSLANSGGLDHLHLIVNSIANSAQVRFEVEQGVLQALGMLGMMQQNMAGAGAP